MNLKFEWAGVGAIANTTGWDRFDVFESANRERWGHEKELGDAIIAYEAIFKQRGWRVMIERERKRNRKYEVVGQKLVELRSRGTVLYGQWLWRLIVYVPPADVVEFKLTYCE